MKNKEIGSDFNYISNEFANSDSFLSKSINNFFFSGRVSIYNLLNFGIQKYNWKKVGFPSYYCHEVVEFCKDLPIEIVYYSYNPFSPAPLNDWDDEPSNVFVNVDYFGISKLDTSFLKNSIIIDDITHNLLSFSNSTADYVFASVRKQLPLPVGGFCYSRIDDLFFDLSINLFATKVTLQKFAAMLLKSLYLQDEFENKDIYRKLFIDAEDKFSYKETNSLMPLSCQLYLNSLNIEELILNTRRNLNHIKVSLEFSEKISLMEDPSETGMGLLFLCINERIRNDFRNFLITNNIFPAILWPKQKKAFDVQMQDRMLFVHADFRYSDSDLNHLIFTINKFLKNV